MPMDDPLQGGQSFRGRLLIASAELVDPNFNRSVVLICRHGEDGALGLILNRPTDMQLKQVWEDVAGFRCDSEQPIYLGGPVDGPLMALHTHESLADFEVFPGLFLTMDKDKLTRLVTEDDKTFRFYVGHAGWAAGQLESEMDELAWSAMTATADHVFHHDETLWEQLFSQTNRPSFLGDIKHVPPDPSMN